MTRIVCCSDAVWITSAFPQGYPQRRSLAGDLCGFSGHDLGASLATYHRH
ncbi:hypothetical protein OAS39_08345 [Pirellulales bacterium]|nr:hypothetical protein [Pirellulales bacterium]